LFPSYGDMFPHRDMLWEEFNGNMRELLRMGDRMASAWGIENRCPFLDRRIIEFAFSLPMEHKIKEFSREEINYLNLMESFQGWNAHAKWANSYGLRKRVLRDFYKQKNQD